MNKEKLDFEARKKKNEFIESELYRLFINTEIKTKDNIYTLIDDLNALEEPEYDTKLYHSILSRRILKYLDNLIKQSLPEDLRHDERIIHDILYQIKFMPYIERYLHSGIVQELEVAYSEKINGKPLTPESYSDFFLNNSVIWRVNHYNYWDYYYNILVPDKFKSDPTFLKNLSSYSPEVIIYIINYIKETPGLLETIAEDFVSRFDSNVTINNLPREMKDYIINSGYLINFFGLSKDKIRWIENNMSCDLCDRLYKRYGKQYQEKYPNVDLNDKTAFLYTMFNSNVLDIIYERNQYTNEDIDFISSFLTYLEETEELKDKYPTKHIREKMELLRKQNSIISMELFNNIVRAKNSPEILKEITDNLGINKDNLYKYVTHQKYWGKEQKEGILTILGGYFHTNVITVYDIIDLLQEMQDKELTKEEILKEKNISVKYFNQLYSELEKTNPELLSYVIEQMKQNSKRGFKKLLKLYYSILNDNIDNENDFVNKYQKTPEEVLEMYKDTDFYDEIYNKISSWYDFGTVGQGSGSLGV